MPLKKAGDGATYHLKVSGPAIFILVWSVLAIGMGVMFARRPGAFEDLAERMGQRRRYSPECDDFKSTSTERAGFSLRCWASR